MAAKGVAARGVLGSKRVDVDGCAVTVHPGDAEVVIDTDDAVLVVTVEPAGLGAAAIGARQQDLERGGIVAVLDVPPMPVDGGEDIVGWGRRGRC
jgi:hypothetical protein